MSGERIYGAVRFVLTLATSWNVGTALVWHYLRDCRGALWPLKVVRSYCEAELALEPQFHHGNCRPRCGSSLPCPQVTSGETKLASSKKSVAFVSRPR